MLPKFPFNNKHRLYNNDFEDLAKENPSVWGWLFNSFSFDIQNRPKNALLPLDIIEEEKQDELDDIISTTTPKNRDEVMDILGGENIDINPLSDEDTRQKNKLLNHRII